MARQPKTYDESAIEHHSGLDAIRKKPAMYLGNMDSTGMWTICREALDNGVDEFRADRNSEIGIVYTKTGVFVWDLGNGIPTGMTSVKEGNTTVKLSTLTLVLTRLHAGGKFNDKGYTNSGGTHGIGMKGANAVSEVFEVYTFRDKVLHTTAFSKGKETQEVITVKSVKSLPYDREYPNVILEWFRGKTGTLIYLEPDKTMFEKGSKLDSKYALEWADLVSYLNPGLEIHVIDESKTKLISEMFHHESLAEYLEEVYEDNKCTPYHSIEWNEVFDIDNHKSTLDIAIGFTDSSSTQLDFFTNGVKNPDGGKHYDAFWNAFRDVIKNYALRNQTFTLNELREGVVGIVHLGLYQPQFASQTKEKLSDVRVYEPMYEYMHNLFTKHFNKNKNVAKEICQRASAIGDLKKQANAQRQALLGIKRKAQTITPSKLAGVHGRAKPEDIEIFLTEGDSAGQSMIQSRDKTTQMVLSLKGKPLNAMKAEDSRVLASEEVANILSSIGYNPSLKDPLSKLSCGKIILLSDSDDDGFHINALVITLLYKYLPELFERGMVYALDSANCKYYCTGKNDDYYFGSSLQDVEQKVAKAKDKVNGKISYLKGWGELSPPGLRIAAANRDTRQLIQLTKLDTKKYEKLIALMGDNADARKQLLGV